MENSKTPTAKLLGLMRGKAPPGRKWAGGVYVPGGPRPNVSPTKVKNPKVAAQANEMHEKWHRNKFKEGDYNEKP